MLLIALSATVVMRIFVFFSKVDCKNAFNLVSRDAVLLESAQNFLCLLLWVAWNYCTKSMLLHPLGNLTSKVTPCVHCFLHCLAQVGSIHTSR